MKLLYPICAVMLLTTVGTGQSFSCRNFELPELGKDFIYLNYANAVLRLQSGDEAGTGYLIDADRGYVITAAHVIEASLKDPSVPISGINPEAGRKTYRLRHVRNLKSQNIDIALLQLVPSGAMSGVVPLDIALRPPRPSRPAYVFGYPRGETAISQQPADYVQGNDDGTMTVKQAAFPGDSGSPLIDDTGKVVGTCIERVLTQERHVSNEAVFIPVSAIQEILKKISINPRTRSLDEKIRNHETSRDELARDLLPTPKNLSNVELYSWAWYMKFHPSPRIASTHFPCPILRALVHRKLEDAEEFLQQTDPATKAAVLIAQGERFEFFNNPQQAAAKFEEARGLVAGLKNDPEGLRQHLTSLEGLARVKLTQGDGEGARSLLAQAVDVSAKTGDQARQSDVLAQLARIDFQRGDPLAIDQLNRALEIQGRSEISPIMEATTALVKQNRPEKPTAKPKSRTWFWISIAIVSVLAGAGIFSYWWFQVRPHFLRASDYVSALGMDFERAPEQSSDKGLSVDARYGGAWQETAARIQARDGILLGFVQLAAAVIGVALAEEKFQYLGILVGYGAFAAAVLTAHHDLIIGKLGLYQGNLASRYNEPNRSDETLEWFSEKNFLYVLRVRMARDVVQGVITVAACSFGLWLSYNPSRIPEPLNGTWHRAWGISLMSSILAFSVMCYVSYQRSRFVKAMKHRAFTGIRRGGPAIGLS
jgi:serine protease Do